MPQELIISLAVLTIMIIVGMIVFLVTANKRNQKQRLLSVISGQSHKVAESDSQVRDKRRADLAKKLQQAGSESKDKKRNVLRDQLNQAGFYQTPIKKYWFYSFFSGLIFTSLAQILDQHIIVVILIAIIGFFGLPKFILNFITKRRQKKFLDEFADALESMVRLLKAGMPVAEAISMVSREYTGPVGEEMTKIYDEQKIGVSLPDACLKAAQRMPLTEMQMFATGISIQQQTGSSLSEVLLNLAKVIRARFRLKRKVQALSAEAKASAMIIGSLPILVGAGLTAVNPEYMEPLFQTLKGKMFLAGAGTWMALGVLVMKQMINFRV